MSQLDVELVAADRKVWEGEATQVSARSIEGELGILPDHSPVLAVLVEGDVKIYHDGSVKHVTIDGGFISVDHNRVTILAESVDTAQMTA